MIVEIIKDSSKHGILFPLIGEYYKAKQYQHDSDKVTLIHQVDSVTFNKLENQHCECGHSDPLCNEYKNNIRIINR